MESQKTLQMEILFQSTLPCRERPVCYSASIYVYDFNPRSRVGSDKKEDFDASEPYISIHAPV